ncbi:MAG TPA: hypothetical protein VGM80_15760 [Gaiellaceae bacterium]
MIRKTLTTFVCVAVLGSQSASALALAHATKADTTAKKKVVTNVTVTGPSVKAHQWGFMVVQLHVTKTTTTVNGKPKVTIKINSISWPTYPDHTPKSRYINAQALPLLQQETMQLQATAGTKLLNISGATHTTVAWQASLQAAILQAETP